MFDSPLRLLLAGPNGTSTGLQFAYIGFGCLFPSLSLDPPLFIILIILILITLTAYSFLCITASLVVRTSLYSRKDFQGCHTFAV